MTGQIHYERCHRCDQLNPVGWYCTNPDCLGKPATYDGWQQFAWALAGAAIVSAVIFGLAVML